MKEAQVKWPEQMLEEDPDVEDAKWGRWMKAREQHARPHLPHRCLRISFFTLPLPTVTVLEEANLKLTCVYIPTPNRHRA